MGIQDFIEKVFHGPASHQSRAATVFPGVPGMEKIEHLVILMMENRSFDHYLGALSRDARYPYRGVVEGLPNDGSEFSNPMLQGGEVQSWPLDVYCGYDDPPHGPLPQIANYDKGAMDGFVKNYQTMIAGLSNPMPNTSAKVPMGFYDRSTLPVLYALADNFTVCDHWFSSMLSSTWPNRKYLHSGRRDGDPDTQTLPIWPGFETTPIWDVLEDVVDPNGNRYTWKSYFSDLPFLAFWYEFTAFHALKNFAPIVDFVHDCREDSLPTVSIIDPPFSLADDHPSHDVRLGQKFLGLLVDALTHSESWDKTALVITYDENGGFFDHVAPPPAFGTNQVDTPMGFRVPSLVISPYTPGGVCKTNFDHTSIMKSIAVRWGIDFPASEFGTRFQDAPEIWSTCFDFSRPPRPRGVYTETADAPAPFRTMAWETGIHEMMTSPQGDLEALIERTFVLPMLKLLDRRSNVYDDLNQFETMVVNMKRGY